MSTMSNISRRVTGWVGSAYGVGIATTLLFLWLVVGCFTGFNNSFQIFGNTVMSAVSYILLFVIQHSINRDSVAVHCKLDELIRAADTADNRMMQIEDMTDEQLTTLQERFRRLADASERHRSNSPDASKSS